MTALLATLRSSLHVRRDLMLPRTDNRRIRVGCKDLLILHFMTPVAASQHLRLCTISECRSSYYGLQTGACRRRRIALYIARMTELSVNATYLGGPTALIEIAGLRLLTDPTL